ncbi:MAG: sodium:solute symporter family protein [Flavobacteriales bacterium]
MTLHFIDWTIIILMLSLSIGISLYYKKRAQQGIENFVLGGRKFPWYLAGISMVATTFAADTPLVVTELVAEGGISGNWIWWAALIGGMFTTFFFASLWRKSGVLTEVEFIELRYGGKLASGLRAVKSVYLGLIMNVAIMAWVNAAMFTILQVFFGFETTTLWFILFGLMLFSALYSSLGGLWGVAVTDAVQFTFAIIASILLAYFVIDSPEIGSLTQLKSKLPEGSLNFFPNISSESVSSSSIYTISIGAFIAFVGVQWWSSWYPGAEPGGGGYVAQRMMSTRSKKDAMLSGLLFQVAHYALRPWPWILVALSCFILYPELMVEQPKTAYVQAMVDYLPKGVKGILLASFLAAYLSTISTQLNWGASYLSNDLIKRFFKPKADSKTLVRYTQWMTVALAVFASIISLYINSISSVWVFVIECGAGLGFILILRWYWWRVNALSEIVASIAPFIFYAFSIYILEPHYGEAFTEAKGTFFFTVFSTVSVSLLAVYFGKSESETVLKNFYTKVKPQGFWKPFTGNKSDLKDLRYNALAWLSGVCFTYSILFSTGYLLFAEWQAFYISISVLVLSFLVLIFSLKRLSL